MSSPYEPDVAAIRADVEALASMRRSSARAGERESAAWLARRLGELGVSDVAVDPYRYQSSYALTHALHEVAGAAGAIIGGIAGAALAALALVSLEQEVSGRRQWLRTLLPAGEGANVVARIPAKSPARASIVLVAHHDAANTGVVWSPSFVTFGARRHLRRKAVDAFMAPVEAALAFAALGAITRRRTPRALAAAILGGAAAAVADVGRAETVPGASDNATGVAVALDVARALAADPLDELDVLLAFVGSEEAGMGGMRVFLDSETRLLHDHPTFILGIDTLGAGRPIVCWGEGAMRTDRYHERDIALVEEGAATAGVGIERWRIGGWTDPVLALHAGLPAASLLTMGPGYLPHYHHPTDTPENVDWESVEAAGRVVGGTLAAYERRLAGRPLA